MFAAQLLPGGQIWVTYFSALSTEHVSPKWAISPQLKQSFSFKAELVVLVLVCAFPILSILRNGAFVSFVVYSVALRSELWVFFFGGFRSLSCFFLVSRYVFLKLLESPFRQGPDGRDRYLPHCRLLDRFFLAFLSILASTWKLHNCKVDSGTEFLNYFVEGVEAVPSSNVDNFQHLQFQMMLLKEWLNLDCCPQWGIRICGFCITRLSRKRGLR